MLYVIHLRIIPKPTAPSRPPVLAAPRESINWMKELRFSPRSRIKTSDRRSDPQQPQHNQQQGGSNFLFCLSIFIPLPWLLKMSAIKILNYQSYQSDINGHLHVQTSLNSLSVRKLPCLPLPLLVFYCSLLVLTGPSWSLLILTN